jgi:transposase-like protein
VKYNGRGEKDGKERRVYPKEFKAEAAALAEKQRKIRRCGRRCEAPLHSRY